METFVLKARHVQAVRWEPFKGIPHVYTIAIGNEKTFGHIIDANGHGRYVNPGTWIVRDSEESTYWTPYTDTEFDDKYEKLPSS